jgi:hypothetical protein
MADARWPEDPPIEKRLSVTATAPRLRNSPVDATVATDGTFLNRVGCFCSKKGADHALDVCSCSLLGVRARGQCQRYTPSGVMFGRSLLRGKIFGAGR